MEKKKRTPLPVLIAAVVLRAVGIILLAAVLLAAGLIAYLSITEYKPAEREAVIPADPYSVVALPQSGASYSIVTWNIGYGALGDNADFFMDGGSSVMTATKERVGENLAGITNKLRELSPDLIFLQETDVSSSRSHRINETEYFLNNLPGHNLSFADNFKVSFLPYPIPPIGKVDSGIATLSAFRVDSAERVQLPIPFSWPVRMANLKRCVLIDRIPVEGTEKQLVLVNLHLEAYDNGEGRAAQTEMLKTILEAEAANGNYVIAGGDFNQVFSNIDASAYPLDPGLWQCGEIDASAFPADWQLLMDSRVPTCRSLDRPYEGADRAAFQYYMIDGFIVSANVRADSIETVDADFLFTDHNPVLLRFTLGG